MFTRKRGAKLAAVAASAALVLAACGGDDEPEGDEDPGAEEGDGDEGDEGDEGSAELGFEACEDDPNGCNSAEVEAGGEVTGLISLPFEAWTDLTTTGNSVYTLQAIAGIRPNGGSQYEPDGTWVWDETFYAELPELVNEDPQTIEFTISDEAVWNDGEPITALDYKYNQYALSGNEDLCAECEPASASDWGLVESVEGSEDGKTVTITLAEGESNPEWEPAYSGADALHPAHLAEAEGFDWENDPTAMKESIDWFAETIPEWSGGPYVIESGQLTETVVKVPNENYYGEAPALDRVVQEVVSEPSTWAQALQNRDLDMGSPSTFDVDVWNELATIPGLYAAAGSAGAVWEHIDLNNENEFLADQELRRAIMTAIDREDTISAIWGAAEGVEPTPRLNHTFSQESPYFEDHATDTGFGSGDIEAAQAILEEAGYTGYEAGETLTTPDGDAVELNFRWTAGNTNRARVGELVQSYLSEIGLAVELVDSDDLGGMLASGDFDMVVFGWSGSPRFVGGLGQLWHSESAANYPRLNEPQIDELASEAEAQTTMDDAAAVANELSQILMENASVLPLWDSPNMDFAFDDLANLRPNHQSSARLYYNMEEWGHLAAQ